MKSEDRSGKNGAKPSLRVLLVEDDPNDAALVLREIRRGPWEVAEKTVDSADAMRESLAGEAFDAVLSDHVLPGFSSLGALEVLKESGRDAPFIVVSGFIGEETAVEVMRAGAKDYVMKANLKRLVPALERELADARDRAERRGLERVRGEQERKILHADKLASMGQLAAGIAHEIRTPLTYVGNNVDTLSGYVNLFLEVVENSGRLAKLALIGKDAVLKAEAERLIAPDTEKRLAFAREDLPQLIRETLDGIARIQDIVRRFKGFVRSDSGDIKACDLNEAVETALKLAWHELKYKCTVEKRLGKIPAVRGRAGELAQVFLNLLVNSAQAVAERGEVAVETSAGEDGFVTVKVSDTGCGIAPEHLDKIFAPFFTTKPEGTGTGLGLSVCREILERHGGSIKAESVPGKGSTFIVRLPAEEALAR